MSFSIRRIYDDLLPVNKKAIDRIIEITRNQIADMTEESFEDIRRFFRNPYHKKMKYMFFVAEDTRGYMKGFIQMSYAPDLNYCFIDLMALAQEKQGGGAGSALYERVREEALNLKSAGIFIECMTDDGRVFRDKKVLRQNKARIRFYERHGARPIINTSYESNSRNHYHNPYFLLYDNLDRKSGLPAAEAKLIIRSILERKYDPSCGRRDIQSVIRSIQDDPVSIREPRYMKQEPDYKIRLLSEDNKISLIHNDGHEIHHIRERGYVESPVRIKSILRELEKTQLFRRVKIKKFPERYLREVHDSDFINYFKQVTMALEPGKTLYPDVFPIRKSVKPPRKLAARAGYYCIDVYSPINRNAYLAARGAVDCALTGALELLDGNRIAYALVRPPGHHADRNSFGGFCYFNSTAIAANYLSYYGKVAILDVDYHHGNGQQDIFYAKQYVLTVSIHADPDFEYPHFSGFSNEKGKGAGEGYNINYPLRENITGSEYIKTLKKAIARIKRYSPDFLVLAFGLDTAKGDPTGTWNLLRKDFYNNGLAIGRMDLPTLVVQEGGYNNRVLGANARSFFNGLWKGMHG